VWELDDVGSRWARAPSIFFVLGYIFCRVYLKDITSFWEGKEAILGFYEWF
jgi:hypothetical protein